MQRSTRLFSRLAIFLWAFSLPFASGLLAQDAPTEGTDPTDVTGQTPPDLAEEKFSEAMGEEGEQAAQPQPAASGQSLNMLVLLYKGGWFMIPIGIMSMLVAVFGIERIIALRRNRVIPQEMVQALGQLAERQGGLDPRLAYRLCQKYRCTASNVIRAVLLKVGRPHAEVEQAVADISEREAAMLYKNIRPINLAVAITPLLGLLGTVWGMIQAFFVTSQAVGGAKAQDLANGIYVALVTTLAGLAVAIVAAILSHFLEGRIQALFRELDDLVQSLLPQLERYEGKLRLTRSNLVSGAEKEPPPAPEAKPEPAAASEN